MPPAALPAELLLAIMDLLASRRLSLTLLRMCLACRGFYAAGLPLLLRRIDVRAGNLDAVVARFEGKRPRGMGFARGARTSEVLLVSEVAVRFAGMGQSHLSKLNATLLPKFRALRSLELDFAGSMFGWEPHSFRNLDNIVVLAPMVMQAKTLLYDSSWWPGNGLLVIHPVDPASFGSRSKLPSIDIPWRPTERPPDRAWRAETGGLIDCGASGGWSLEQQRGYWEAFGRVSVVA